MLVASLGCGSGLTSSAPGASAYQPVRPVFRVPGPVRCCREAFLGPPRCSKFLAQCLNVLALEEARHFCLPAQLNALEAHSRLPLAAHSRLQQTIFSKWEVMQCNIQPVYSDKDIVFCSCAGKSHQTIVSEVRTKALFGLEINFILISREEMRQQAHAVNKVPVHNELLIVDADQQPQ